MRKVIKIVLSIVLLISIVVGDIGGISKAEASEWNVAGSNGYYTKWRSKDTLTPIKQVKATPNIVATRTLEDSYYVYPFNYDIASIENVDVSRIYIIDVTLEINNHPSQANPIQKLILSMYTGVYEDNTHPYRSFLGHNNHSYYGAYPEYANFSFKPNATNSTLKLNVGTVSRGVLGLFSSGVNLGSATVTLKEVNYIVFDYYIYLEVTAAKGIDFGVVSNLGRGQRMGWIAVARKGTGTENINFSYRMLGANSKYTDTAGVLGKGYEIIVGVTYLSSETSGYPNVATRHIQTVKIFIPDSAYEGLEAANAAKKAADEAKTAAADANQKVNRIINDSLAVRDANGNIIVENGQPKIINLSEELKSTKNLITSLDQAISNNQNSINERLNQLSENVNSNITNMEEKLDQLNQNFITNIQSYLPPILLKVHGYKNATATTSGNFRISIDYTNATEYRYKINDGSWTEWASLSSHDSIGYITTIGYGYGANIVSIEIRNTEDGTVARSGMTVFSM